MTFSSTWIYRPSWVCSIFSLKNIPAKKVSQSSSTSIASCPCLPLTQAFYFSHHFLKRPIRMLASVRRENAYEGAFETSFCFSVVTRWEMQALSQKTWFVSSQSWFIPVLWGDQQELQRSSSASHLKTLRWLFTAISSSYSPHYKCRSKYLAAV